MVQIIKDNLKSISNLEIEGVLFIVENISYTNTLPKRTLNRMKVINGTEIVTNGEYTPLEFEITTTINVPVNRPDYYNDAFTELQSKICSVVSPLMGSFKAELTINMSQLHQSQLKFVSKLKRCLVNCLIFPVKNDSQYLKINLKLKSINENVKRLKNLKKMLIT